MAKTFGGRLKHAWNAFTNQERSTREFRNEFGQSYTTRPDRPRIRHGNNRSIISAIYARLSIDIASAELRHVVLDDQKRYAGDKNGSGLNECLSVQANLDQMPSQFLQDAALTLFEEGVIAIVAVDTTINPDLSGGYDILSLRVGDIVEWEPRHVRVNLYNENTGRREHVLINKKNVAIVINPLYSVMNEHNSTFQRLNRKLNLLDSVDEASGSGKLDIIIQLPYVAKSENQRSRAEQRRKDIEFQLKDSAYGIAYIDGSEKITQLNRGSENNLLKQIEYLTDQLYSHLGVTPEIMNGTADEQAMLNYMDRTIEPVLQAITESMRAKFLTKTARTQGQSIMYFKDPFKLVPMSALAEIADKLTRNEIISSNEMRGFIGMRPSTDPRADELRNSNMPDGMTGAASTGESVVTDDSIMDEAFNNIDASLDSVFADLGVSEDEE